MAEPDTADTPAFTTGAPGARSVDGPRQIGVYRLLSVLGEGGFGVVYLAEQTEPVRRRVALKVIKPGMDSRQVLARFDQERQALALMDHPNVAKVFDAGATPDRRPFFVMEHVPGEPITEFCDRHRLPIVERLDLFIRVCEAVQHAHQKGIIHRDIKPGNILVEYEDGRATPKVIDFGVAKATGRGLTEQTLFTEQGQLIGTPEYMSPEQAEMSAVDIDTRSDIYSLGVLLYELLTGTLPFDAKDLRSGALAHIQRIIREVEPPRPATRLAAHPNASELAARRGAEAPALARRLRGDLTWIVMRAMDKDRSRRYESAAELAADVRRHLRHLPVLAGPPATSYRMRKFVRRHRVGVLAGVAVAIAVLGGSAVAGWMAVRARDAERTARQERNDALIARGAAESQRQAADQARARAQFEAATATAISTFLNDMLASVDPDKALGREVTVREVLDRAAERLAGQFKDRPEVETALRQTIASTYYQLGDFAAAARHWSEAYDLSKRTLGPEHERTLAAGAAVVQGLLVSGGVQTAVGLAEELIAVQSRLLGARHPDTLRSRMLQASTTGIAGGLKDAEEKWTAIFEDAAGVLAPDSNEILAATGKRSKNLILLGRAADAERLCAEAIPLAERSMGARSRTTMFLMNTRAWALTVLGRYSEAEPIRRHVLEGQRAVLAPDHPDIFETMSTLAWLLKSMRRAEEAEPLAREAYQGFLRVQGPDDGYTVDAMTTLGSVLTSLDRYAEAAPLFQEALEIRRRTLGPDHPLTVGSLNNMGSVLWYQRRYVEAHEVYRQVLEARRRVLGEDHPETMGALNNVGLALRAAGRLSEAEAVTREVIEGRRRVLGPQHADTLDSQRNLGILLRTAERPDEAAEVLRPTADAFGSLFGRNHAQTLDTMYLLGMALKDGKKYAEAEAVFRETGSLSAGSPTSRKGTEHAYRSYAASCLRALGRFEEAEKDLLSAYQGLLEARGPSHSTTQGAAEELVRLYQDWNKPALAEEWMTRLKVGPELP